jgi:DNA-binding transcriptional regulator of glucitol operon
MAGLPTPPNAYDIIYSPPQTSPDSQITSPAMFSDVRGQVSFIGSANGEGFDFYRLQVGQGLNPQQWIQISQDVTQPVKNGLLGTWNTEGLSGLYAVQLLVVHKDQRVETAVSQITVDNQPPVVSILNPGKGQSYSKNSSIVFQANASDDVTLAKVEFYIDDQLVATLTEPPFTVSRQAKVGTHSLRVRATDMAGNFSEAKLDFIVK